MSEPGAQIVSVVQRYVADESWSDPQSRDQLLSSLRCAQHMVTKYEAAISDKSELPGDRKAQTARAASMDAFGFYKRSAALLQEIAADVMGR